MLFRSHELSDQLLDKISNYEQKCISNFQSNIENESERIHELLKEAAKFSLGEKRFLTRYEIQDSEIDEKMTKVNEYSDKLAKEAQFLNKLKLGPRLKLQKRVHENGANLIANLLPGHICCEPKELESLDLSSFLTDLKHNCNIKRMNEREWAAAFVNRNENLHLKVFNKKGVVLKEKLDIFKDCFVFYNNFVHISSNDTFALYAELFEVKDASNVEICGEYRTAVDCSSGQYSILLLLDSNFKVLNHANTHLFDMHVLGQEIVCFESGTQELSFFDLNLELKRKIKFDHRIDIDRVLGMSERHLFCYYDNQKLKVVEQSSQLVIKEFAYDDMKERDRKSVV